MALEGHPITISTPALGYTYAVAGRRADAEAFLRELQDLSGRRYVPSYYMATTYVGLGDREKAFQWLDRAYDERSQWLLYLLKTDPMLDPLRDDPRLMALLRRVETPEWRSRGSSE